MGLRLLIAKTYYMKSQGGGFTIMQANDVGGNISALQRYNGSLFMLSGIHSIYPHGLYFGSSTAMQPADPCIMPAPDTLEFKRYDNTDRVTLLAKGFGNTPLDASQLLSGTVPDERLSANVQMKPVPPPTVSAASRLLGRGANGAGAMEEIVLGTGLSMTGTTLNAEGGSTLPPTVAYTDVANVFTQNQTINRGPFPSLTLLDPNLPTGYRTWRIYTDNDLFYIQPFDDANINPLSVGVVIGGDGRITATGLGTTPLNASNLTSGTVPTAALPLTLAYTDVANVFTQNQLIRKAGYAALELRDTTSAVDFRDWHIGASNGILRISPYSDAGVEQANAVSFFRGGTTEWYGDVSYYANAKFYTNVTVGGILQVGSVTPNSTAHGAFRAGSGRLELVRGDQAVYYPFYCHAISTYAGGSSLADLTVTGGTNFAGGVLGTSGSFSSAVGIAGKLDVTGGSATVYASAPIEIRMASNPRIGFHWPAVVASQIGMDSAGTIRTFDNPGSGYAAFACAALVANGTIQSTSNTWVSNLHTMGYVYPGNYGANTIQGSWFFAGHGSYGIYCNTGLYCAGDVWASGVSVAGSLAGKMNNLVQTHGPITLQYGTQNSVHASVTQVAAPAGGTGTAAGGWSTAANRDAAIASINAARTDIINIKSVMCFLISALKGNGVIA